MGVWGTAIFSDDTACDIRDEYSALLISGISDEEAEEALLKGYESLNGTWDEPVVWLALAFCEWKKGRLSERVKKRAIEIIDSGEDLQHWKESSSAKECRQREKELQKLKTRLESPMPERRPVRKPTVDRVPWKAGDLLAYKIMDHDIPYPEYTGKFVLLRVLKILKIGNPVSKYLGEEYKNERALLGYYNWSGDEVPDPKIVNHLSYEIVNERNDPIFGKTIQTCISLGSMTKKELKAREIYVIDHDPSYETSLPDFFDTRFNKYSWVHFHTLDMNLSRFLSRLGHKP